MTSSDTDVTGDVNLLADAMCQKIAAAASSTPHERRHRERSRCLAVVRARIARTMSKPEGLLRLVEEGVISARDLSLFHFVETADEAWQIIQDFYAQVPVE